MYLDSTVKLQMIYSYSTTNSEVSSPSLEHIHMSIFQIENPGYKAKESRLLLELLSINDMTSCITYTHRSIK